MKSSGVEARSGWTSSASEKAAILLCLAMVFGAATSYAKENNVANLASENEIRCSEVWYRSIEEKVPTGDGRGHDPDIGSDEWKSVVEFKLGVRGNPDVPRRDSEHWCRYVNQLIRINSNSSPVRIDTDREFRTTQPSFPCDKVKAGSVEAMICADEVLSVLDRKLAGVYTAALKKAENQHPPMLKAEQRGWIKGRNECWKAVDQRDCGRNEYERRIAELQARYRLVPHKGPIRLTCDGTPVNEVVVTFFSTNPPALIAERGDSVSLMYLQPNGSGSMYQGRNEIFWEHQGQALITWGYEAPEIRCMEAP